MPELPEVETVRRDLDREFAGKKVKAVQVTGARSVRRGTKPQLSKRLVGRTFKTVKRKGKYLIVVLDSGEWFVVHLRMSGQLLKATPRAPKPNHTHVVIEFTHGNQLRFVDPRTFGEVFLVDPAKLAEEAPDLAELGWDPLEDPMLWVDFARMVLSRRQQLKALLTDQKVIAGLGNIYSDEVLHAAGLRFDRPSNTLTVQEVRRLFRAILEVVHDAVAARGSSLADEQYVDLSGRPGSYQEHHQVYGREGKACLRCRATIERTKWGGRSTFYCPSCQV
ncbi:MAG TPA: bifunctional DNA-formamidopyrimidine glycosylase/DNA-(apurinic or apyrimidinic site) lyase [Acidimicrobiales bacterium]|jgi:formamidopyrimidine-DNA glycosylase|nr:bifunctional DNA-formamidopyrimidine glycosylase/DNA-(apurinic or apyrimidinic site) lyase [Acidimicrobiales bacterium]